MRTAFLRKALAVAETAKKADLGLIAAGVAFYAMLALFPGAGAIIALWGFVSDPAVIESQLALMRGIVPEQVMAILSAQFDQLIATTGRTLGWATALSTGLAVITARGGVAALLKGLNAVYGTPNRTGLRQTLQAILLTVALMGIALVALAAVVVIPVIVAFFPPGPVASVILAVTRWAGAVLVMVFGLGLIYRYGPNRDGRRSAWITPGAGVALAIWVAASLGFSVYVANFANYNQVYGTLGAVVALLLWLWLSAWAVLIGAAVNRALSEDAAR